MMEDGAGRAHLLSVKIRGQKSDNKGRVLPQNGNLIQMDFLETEKE